MPIKPANRKLYPKDWSAIRQRILARANDRCERCRLPNHAVGYRDRDGRFIPHCGNGPCDAAGQGLTWPGLKPLSHAEAMEFTEHNNDCVDKSVPVSRLRMVDEDGNHWIVIVLTIAHLDHDPQNNADANLAALCQRCHNRHDRRHRATSRQKSKGQLLFGGAA